MTVEQSTPNLKKIKTARTLMNHVHASFEPMARCPFSQLGRHEKFSVSRVWCPAQILPIVTNQDSNVHKWLRKKSIAPLNAVVAVPTFDDMRRFHERKCSYCLPLHKRNELLKLSIVSHSIGT